MHDAGKVNGHPLRMAIHFKTIDPYYLQFLQVQLSPQLQF